MCEKCEKEKIDNFENKSENYENNDYEIKEEKEIEFSIFTQIGAILSFVFHFKILYFIVLVILFNLFEKRMSFFTKNLKELLNFYLSLGMYSTIMVLFLRICFLVNNKGLINLSVATLMFYMFLVLIIGVISLIMAILESKKGKVYYYPLTIRFLK